ncbi:pyridine nucleotide NAD(P) transhydrogenase alpha plus beta subunits [Cryptosporidium sp. chipmunk genotype I]|uniref:pyridine nucleotide NAD(P) transhydrogenase alpha plus beta subunits n=1 Tax=Cryptosporidium sp. chipmunk genotype I TaxID=1280935 RepID=UPI003519EC15|nr:pyridine nucleotide NAD(P) transhydrogenase alpha plus beta subunits [Cryptosporidium sp. chipmunk genotype I]
MRKLSIKLGLLVFSVVLLVIFALDGVDARLQGGLIEGRGRNLFLGLSEIYKTSNSGSLIMSGQLFAALCFIYCIKGLSSEKTAYRSNIVGFVGMLVAIMVSLSEEGFGSHYFVFFLTTIVSGAVGVYIADKTQLIKMPQLVAIFHSFVGLAALFVSYSYFYSAIGLREGISGLRRMELFVGGAMGMVTFLGSVIAALKLDDIIPSKSVNIPLKNISLSIILFSICTTGLSFCVSSNELVITTNLHCGMILSALFGIFMIIGIGGADMPVIISMLNSYSGWSTAITGFLLDNSLLIISGALIGSSGAILSYIMCKGMNRNFISVLLGGFDQEETEKIVGGTKFYTTSSKETAEILAESSKILIVPGYGMAVSKCQDVISGIIKELESRSTVVEIGIHPVAGRMPGHMNVLLAEADVPTRIVKEMETVNKCMQEYDLVLVVGANDIVNPAALDPQSKISGMPVINVWKAKQVIVSKRSLAYGYASINNELFTCETTKMLLGDSREMLQKVYKILKGCAGFVPRQYMDSRVTEETEEAEDTDEVTTALLSSKQKKSSKTLGDNSLKNKKVRGVGETETESMSLKKCSKKIALLPIVSEQDKTILFPIPPSKVYKFREKGYEVAISRDVLTSSSQSKYFSEEVYMRSGAFVYKNIEELIKECNVMIKMARPTEKEAKCMKQGQMLICNMQISQYQDKENNQDQLLASLTKNGVTVIALDEVPRTSRAQTMDIRTTTSTISGYRAVVEAFNSLPRISKSISSAAGNVEESTVLVIGVGVAGLQAIATAKSMGTKVFAMDSRSTSKEEAESCGARFIQVPSEGGYLGKEELLKKQRDLIEKYLCISDIVITSACKPGEECPILITKEAVRKMKSGSVIVDLCSEFGGNCELSQKDRIFSDTQSGITIIGKCNYVFSMPLQSSELFSGNLLALISELGPTSDRFKCDLNNEIISRMCVAHENKMLWKPFSEKNQEKHENQEMQEKKSLIQNITKQSTLISIKDENIFTRKTVTFGSETEIYVYLEKVMKEFKRLDKNLNGGVFFYAGVMLTTLFFTILGLTMTTIQIQNIFSFIISTMLGYYCVWDVDSKLHTPLMSVTNALSGVIIIGSMMQYGNQTVTYTTLMSMVSTFLASINTFGGFYVTNKMLALFTS